MNPRELRVILPPDLPNDRYATITHAVFSVLDVAGIAEESLVRVDDLATDTLAADYWQLAEPFCASLQVAARWAEGQALAAWGSALREIAGQAVKQERGIEPLLALRHVPVLLSRK